MNILGIDNRTENWRTAQVFCTLSDQQILRLVKKLGGEQGLSPAQVHLELFWKGMRDYLEQTKKRKNDSIITLSNTQIVTDSYRRLFPDLRTRIIDSGLFRKLEAGNYDVSTQERKHRLITNLISTEIDIVLESPEYVFIGEAKHKEDFGENPRDVLMNQFIREYVMAKMLVDCLRSDKEVIPFVVVTNKALRKHGRIQTEFAISQDWMSKDSVLTWDDVEKLAEG